MRVAFFGGRSSQPATNPLHEAAELSAGEAVVVGRQETRASRIVQAGGGCLGRGRLGTTGLLAGTRSRRDLAVVGTAAVGRLVHHPAFEVVSVGKRRITPLICGLRAHQPRVSGCRLAWPRLLTRRCSLLLVSH